jgi:hypothetical protein
MAEVIIFFASIFACIGFFLYGIFSKSTNYKEILIRTDGKFKITNIKISNRDYYRGNLNEMQNNPTWLEDDFNYVIYQKGDVVDEELIKKARDKYRDDLWADCDRREERRKKELEILERLKD